MVEVRFTGNPAEIRSEMAQLLGAPAPLAPSNTSRVEAAPATDKKPSPKKDVEPAKATEAAPTIAAGSNFEAAKAQIVPLIAKIGKEEFKKLLGTYAKVSDMPEEVRAEFIAKANQILK